MFVSANQVAESLKTNSLPNNKIWSLKLKALADHKQNVAQIKVFVSESVENIVRKGENAGYQHFPFSHNVFKRLFP